MAPGTLASCVENRLFSGNAFISIANALDAMLSDCPYRNALPMSHAREEIRRCAGTQFDPRLVEVFLPFQKSTGLSFVKTWATLPPEPLEEYGVVLEVVRLQILPA